MILQIDVTVTGPGGVMTGSTAVTVNEPTAPAVTPPAPGQNPAGDLANRRMRQRAQAMRGGVSRA